MYCRGHHQIYEAWPSTQHKWVDTRTHTFTLQRFIALCSRAVCYTMWFYLRREVINLHHYVISDSTGGSWAPIANCCLQLTWPQICITSTMKKNMPMAFNYTQMIRLDLTGNDRQYPSPLAFICTQSVYLSWTTHPLFPVLQMLQ